MKILGINLDKCNATEMFKKLEHEVEFQKTVVKTYAMLAVNCYRRDFIENKDFVPNGKCSFISDEQYEQMEAEFSDQYKLEKHISNKNQEMWDILKFSTLSQEEQKFFEREEKLFSSYSEDLTNFLKIY